MKIEGFLKAAERFFDMIVKTFSKPKMIAKLGSLNVKINVFLM